MLVVIRVSDRIAVLVRGTGQVVATVINVISVLVFLILYLGQVSVGVGIPLSKSFLVKLQSVEPRCVAVLRIAEPEDDLPF